MTSVDSPLTQRGFRIHEWGGDLIWEEFPIAAPSPGEVLVEVGACGVGLTVLNYMRGDLKDSRSSLPRVPGHEIFGWVRRVGGGVDPGLMGESVVGYFYLSCGRCPRCAAENEPMCQNGNGRIGTHRDGGYAPWAVLPVFNAIPVPHGLDAVAGTVVPDAVATSIHVIKRAGLDESDRVVVIGAGGGVGIHLIQVAALSGARVCGLDVTGEKLEAIESLGADAALSNDEIDVDPLALFGGAPPSVVVDLVGSSATSSWAVDSLDSGGRLVGLTTFPGRTVTVEQSALVAREISILGSRYASRDEVRAAARLVTNGAVKPVVGETVVPSRLMALHDRLRRGTLVGRGALRWVSG